MKLLKQKKFLTLNQNFYLARVYRIFLLLIGLSLVEVPSLKADVSTLYNEAAVNFHRLYEKNDFRKFAHNWYDTIEQFLNIQKKYPHSIQASKSLYNAGSLYRSLYKWNSQKSNIQNSSQNYLKLVKQYPKNYLADDALYQTGINYLDYEKKPNSASKYFKQLLEKYPKSPLVSQAKEHLKKLPKAPQQKSAKVSLTNKTKKVAKTSVKKPIKKSTQDTLATKKTTTSAAKNSSSKAATSNTSFVKNLDYWTTAEWTRVVLTLNQKVDYKYNTLPANAKLKKDPRLYLDVLNTTLPKGFQKKLITENGIIKQLRISQFNSETVRLVLDLYHLDEIRIFDNSLTNESKIIIDVQGKASIPSWENILTDLKEEKEPDELTLKDALGLKIKRIIIDPGHGGRDPGAVGFSHYEKKIVMSLAKILKQEINRKLPKVEVAFTREKDHFLSLEKRTALANEKKGDLFISIHCNAHTDRRVRGIETYYLNLTDDQNSLNLAARENKTSLKSVSDLQAILNDLVTYTKMHESRKLAELVHDSTIQRIKKNKNYRYKDLGVKSAPFFVLIGSQMPSILLEVGFISNPYENKLLRNPVYLKRLAQGISNGISDYVQYVQKI